MIKNCQKFSKNCQNYQKCQNWQKLSKSGSLSESVTRSTDSCVGSCLRGNSCRTTLRLEKFNLTSPTHHTRRVPWTTVKAISFFFKGQQIDLQISSSPTKIGKMVFCMRLLLLYPAPQCSAHWSSNYHHHHIHHHDSSSV